MRNITHIVVHCSASQASADIGAEQIRQWHKDRGFDDIGYHYVIRRNGTVEEGRKLEIPGAHVEGRNKTTIGICLAGGIDSRGVPEANFTFSQYKALYDLVTDLREAYPQAAVCGHKDFPRVGKACPCFNVREFFNGQR